MPTPPDPGSPGWLRRAPATLIVIAATALLVGAVIALVDGRDEAPLAADGPAGPAAVTIRDFSFTPADLTVSVGRGESSRRAAFEVMAGEYRRLSPRESRTFGEALVP